MVEDEKPDVKQQLQGALRISDADYKSLEIELEHAGPGFLKVSDLEDYMGSLDSYFNHYWAEAPEDVTKLTAQLRWAEGKKTKTVSFFRHNLGDLMYWWELLEVKE